ncbi:hypothetical protein BpHYR1_052935 [Brachionus plicatilis]|uniref:Chitin-binding type-2 domain-containing protein n=1 Tax=Brachionus plicatilis TaxID=10195 RepID=A0A3M7P278_BRAPC|nr:hypothetical protein BpHYR1_052935 [Brachionus plicatilis]
MIILALVKAYKGQYYNQPSENEKGGRYGPRITRRILKCSRREDLARVRGRCNQYTTCENGSLKFWNCPKNYVFDSTMKACSPKHLTPNACSNQS